MIDFIIWLVLAALWIWGIYFMCRRGQIFVDIGNVGKKVLPKWLQKPLFLCPMCMSSIHGTLIYVVSPMHYNFWLHALFLVTLCGLNVIIDGLTESFDD